MKQCPACRRAYTDETLNYCLDDGELLIYGPASFDPKTALLSSENMPDEAAAPNLDPASSGARRPHVLSSARTRLQAAVDDTQEPTGHTTALIRPHPTSSAEYIVGQIKLHRKRIAIGVVMILAAVAVFLPPASILAIAAFVVLLLGGRRREGEKYAGLRILR